MKIRFSRLIFLSAIFGGAVASSTVFSMDNIEKKQEHAFTGQAAEIRYNRELNLSSLEYYVRIFKDSPMWKFTGLPSDFNAMEYIELNNLTELANQELSSDGEYYNEGWNFTHWAINHYIRALNKSELFTSVWNKKINNPEFKKELEQKEQDKHEQLRKEKEEQDKLEQLRKEQDKLEQQKKDRKASKERDRNRKKRALKKRRR